MTVRLISAFGLLTFVAVALASPHAQAAQGRARPALTVGTLLATLQDPGATTNDNFASSVAVTAKAAIVGAYEMESDAGAAYIYRKLSSGWSKSPVATLDDPQATAGDDFGLSVSVSGSTAVVGAPGADSGSGAVYIYSKSGSGWPTSPTVTFEDPTSPARDSFGESVSVSGGTAIVGANTGSGMGTAYVYTMTSSGWPSEPSDTWPDPAAQSGDDFGSAVSVSGKLAVVGADGTDASAGAAYIYKQSTSGWPSSPTVSLQDPAATAGDEFGDSVSVTGATAIVGASASDSAAGAAYIYVKGNNWATSPTTTLEDPGAKADDDFGQSVSISGTTAVVGSLGAGSGSGYVYKLGTSGWATTPTVTLQDPADTAGDSFGESAAVSGKTSVFGSPGSDFSAGTAYIYKT
jgi:hypothetical protein